MSDMIQQDFTPEKQEQAKKAYQIGQNLIYKKQVFDSVMASIESDPVSGLAEAVVMVLLKIDEGMGRMPYDVALAAALMLSGWSNSPLTTSTPAAARAFAFSLLGSLVRALTLLPFSIRAFTTAPPCWPVAPVTNIMFSLMPCSLFGWIGGTEDIAMNLPLVVFLF